MVNSSLNQNQALFARLQSIHQQQHKRLARRIHDHVSQHLTLLSLQLSLALSEETPPPDWSNSCQKWSGLVLELGQNLRTILNDLQPRVADEVGLGTALQWYAHSYPEGVRCKLTLPPEPTVLPTPAGNELFNTTRDIVSEILAPNGVEEAAIALEQTHDRVCVHVRVNEKKPGLAAAASKALETLSAHDRLFCMDGEIEVHEEPDKGLTITMAVPANPRAVPCAA